MSGLGISVAISRRRRALLPACVAVVALLGTELLPSFHFAAAHTCEGEAGAGAETEPSTCFLCWHYTHDFGSAELIAGAVVGATPISFLDASPKVVARHVVRPAATARAPPLPI
jgi:hypothetical protein